MTCGSRRVIGIRVHAGHRKRELSAESGLEVFVCAARRKPFGPNVVTYRLRVRVARIFSDTVSLVQSPN